MLKEILETNKVVNESKKGNHLLLNGRSMADLHDIFTNRLITLYSSYDRCRFTKSPVSDIDDKLEAQLKSKYKGYRGFEIIDFTFNLGTLEIYLEGYPSKGVYFGALRSYKPEERLTDEPINTAIDVSDFVTCG